MHHLNEMHPGADDDMVSTLNPPEAVPMLPFARNIKNPRIRIISGEMLFTPDLFDGNFQPLTICESNLRQHSVRDMPRILLDC